MNKRNRLWQRLLALAIGSMVLAIFGATIAHAADPSAIHPVSATASHLLAQATPPPAPTVESVDAKATTLIVGLDTVWVLLTGFLVFFMQTGFAILETGLVRQRGAVNALLENFIDAGLTAIVFWAVGFGIAFGTSSGGFIGTNNFFLNDAMTMTNGAITYAMGAVVVDGAPTYAPNINTLTLFFFQFAFAATASTITTGSMAGRTDFVGDLIYSAIMGAISYPIIVHWAWNPSGWLAAKGFLDFAGSAVVHTVGGVTALVGAYILGPRPNRPPWGTLPPAHNLGLATLGTMILWFGWYGFNPGSTLGVGNTGLIGLVCLNTTLAAGAAAMTTLIFQYFRSKKWDLVYCLNGSLAGLVGVTAGCAFVAPWASIVIGITAGILVVVVVDVIEAVKIDDPVGAFAVHGSCGMMGTLAIGFLGEPGLIPGGKAGLLRGGGVDILLWQTIGILAIVAFTAVFTFVMFSVLNAVGRLRVAAKADEIGIDFYEHGASIWPDVYTMDDLGSEDDIKPAEVSPIGD